MNPTKTLLTLFVCLLPLSVIAEEYVCSMSYEDRSLQPYVLSVKRDGEQFFKETTNAERWEKYSGRQIQEDESQIALTKLFLGGMVEVLLIEKESLKVEHEQISTEGNIFWIPRRGTCMVRE